MCRYSISTNGLQNCFARQWIAGCRLHWFSVKKPVDIFNFICVYFTFIQLTHVNLRAGCITTWLNLFVEMVRHWIWLLYRFVTQCKCRMCWFSFVKNLYPSLSILREGRLKLSRNQRVVASSPKVTVPVLPEVGRSDVRTDPKDLSQNATLRSSW